IRLMEVLLHGGPQLNGWRTAQIHEALLSAPSASPPSLFPDPAPLRPTQDESPRPAGAPRPILLLPTHPQRHPGGGPVHSLPQARLRPSGQQPVPPPPPGKLQTTQQNRNRLLPS